jgi:hypothetical protein
MHIPKSRRRYEHGSITFYYVVYYKGTSLFDVNTTKT